MTKEEFLKLDEETQTELIISLVELWAKNTENKAKRSAFVCLANAEDEEHATSSNCMFGTGELILSSIIKHMSNYPELGMLLARYLIIDSLKKSDK